MSRPALSTVCHRCQTRIQTTPSNTLIRPFSSTHHKKDQRKPNQIDPLSLFDRAIRAPDSRRPPPPARPRPDTSTTSTSTTDLESLAQGARDEASTRPSSGVSADEPYHLNVYSHRHNMHITFTEPSRNPIISYSGGNIGLRHAQRGSFDAAYQLSTYTMRKMAEKQWRIGGKGMTQNKMLTLSEPEVRSRGIELVLRGFGTGREAFQKALVGNEGKLIKPLIRKVTDATRLKFGGTRSPQVRRLG